MSGKRVQAKHKIDRRMGANIWGRPKSPYNKRQTGPGMHGARRGKPTDYGLQLFAKQKLKGYYGSIGEKKFRSYFKEANRLKGDTGHKKKKCEKKREKGGICEWIDEESEESSSEESSSESGSD